MKPGTCSFCPPRMIGTAMRVRERTMIRAVPGRCRINAASGGSVEIKLLIADLISALNTLEAERGGVAVMPQTEAGFRGRG